MNRALHIVVVLAIAVHMLCGCCLHHAHASGSPLDVAPSAEARCSCEHHGHQHEGEPANHGGHDQGCEDESCTFTRPESPDSSDLWAGLHGLSLVLYLPTLSSLSELDTAEWAPVHCGPPVSLYLLNQVLLI